MLVYLIKTLICSGTLYLLYYWLLRKQTYFHLNRIYLLSILVLSAIIPYLHISVESYYTQDSFIQSFINNSKELFFTVWLDEVIVLAKAPYSWVDLLETTYLIGIFVFSLRIILFLYRIIVLRLASRVYTIGHIKLLVHEKPFAAFSFMHYIYANKEDFQSSHFKVIWKHELAHIQHLHTIESFLLEIICCLFWFNPFVWAIKHKLKDIHEYQIDAHLVKKGINRIDYQQQLVNYVLRGELFSGGSHFATSVIKHRIAMLIKKPSPWQKKIRFVVVVPVLMLLLSAFSLKYEKKILRPQALKSAKIEDVSQSGLNLSDTIPKIIDEKVK